MEKIDRATFEQLGGGTSEEWQAFRNSPDNGQRRGFIDASLQGCCHGDRCPDGDRCPLLPRSATGEFLADPGFGKPYACGPDRPSYVTPDGVRVWMWRKGQRVRFFDADGEQVGPEHRNVAPAIVSAAFEGWIDPTNVFLSVAVIGEVRSNARG